MKSRAESVATVFIYEIQNTRQWWIRYSIRQPMERKWTEFYLAWYIISCMHSKQRQIVSQGVVYEASPVMSEVSS
jgi:hypothetical protein